MRYRIEKGRVVDGTGSGTEAARSLAARRKREARKCQTCGNEFTGVVTRRYCSAACRLRASRRRMKQQPASAANALAELAAARERFSRGQLFDNSAEMIRQERDLRTAQLAGEDYSEEQAAIDGLNRQRELNAAHGWANSPEGVEILRELREPR